MVADSTLLQYNRPGSSLRFGQPSDVLCVSESRRVSIYSSYTGILAFFVLNQNTYPSLSTRNS